MTEPGNEPSEGIAWGRVTLRLGSQYVPISVPMGTLADAHVRAYRIERSIIHTEEGHKGGFAYINSSENLYVGLLEGNTRGIKQALSPLPWFRRIDFHDATTPYLLAPEPFPGARELIWPTASYTFKDVYVRGLKMHGKKLYIPKRNSSKRGSSAIDYDCEECKKGTHIHFHSELLNEDQQFFYDAGIKYGNEHLQAGEDPETVDQEVKRKLKSACEEGVADPSTWFLSKPPPYSDS